ncbi:DUF6602 domain-containing protein [Undibacterium sp. Tian12W]|uniref:DUF6602 domain-containing protein n=1 Tax=Undibacterium sp. Tian12W TaxID=3413054 RepID=UPI003BF08DC8
MDWEALFSASSNKLMAELAECRAALEHRGLKGTANEATLAEALRVYLPGSIEVCTGEVIDSNGGRSQQADILLFDGATAPRFFSQDNINVLPVEAVYAAIEVKTYLNKQAIEEAFKNMKAFKQLDKSAFHPNRATTDKLLYGMPSQHWPVQFFIFAYESDSLETVLNHVKRLNASQPIHQQIDLVCILDKGLILNVGPEGLQPIPMPDTNLIAKPSSKALLTFYALLIHLYGQASNEPIFMAAYLKHIQH